VRVAPAFEPRNAPEPDLLRLFYWRHDETDDGFAGQLAIDEDFACGTAEIATPVEFFDLDAQHVAWADDAPELGLLDASQQRNSPFS
jgi:hypothetical protein